MVEGRVVIAGVYALAARRQAAGFRPGLFRSDRLAASERRSLGRSGRTRDVSGDLLAKVPVMDRSGRVGSGLGDRVARAPAAWAAEDERSFSGRHVRARQKRGDEIGKTKRGKGSKIEIVVDARGVPLGADIAAANIAEVDLAEPVLAQAPIAVPLPADVPAVADKAYDSDLLRSQLRRAGFALLSPHRAGRKKPSANDGRRMRRYKRRWLVERTNAWLQNFRRLVVRYERHACLFLGFVQLACAIIAIRRL